MKQRYFEVNGKDYMDKVALAEAIYVSEPTARKYIKEIEALVGEGFYKKYAVIRNGNMLLVNYLVAIHYLTYKSYFKEAHLRKYIPEYDAREIKAFIGFERVVTLEPKMMRGA